MTTVRVSKSLSDRREVFESHPDWIAVEEVALRLLAAGFETYLAGGCVRDLCRKVVPKDFDIATKASPDEIEALFSKTISVGRQFGVMVVVHLGVSIEVTRFRADLGNLNQRHPEKVEFSSPEEDAKRRDLTINALFLDLQKMEIIDYVGGLQDLVDRKLRAVGDPRLRFEEDHLRILRVLRFYSEFSDFEIEKQTQVALLEMTQFSKSVSLERFRDEWTKLLHGVRVVKALRFCSDHQFLKIFFPTLLFRSEMLDACFSSASRLKSVWLKFGVWAMSSGNSIETILSEFKKLKFSNLENRYFEKSLELLALPSITWQERAAYYQLIVESQLEDVFELWQALRGAASPESAVWIQDKLKSFPTLPQALVRAELLTEFYQGAMLGRCLKRAYQIQIENSELDTKQILQQLKLEFP